MAAGGTLIVYAVGYDAQGNYVSDESVSWTATGVCSGNLSPMSGTSTTFTAATAGDGTITADHATVTNDATGTITITATAVIDIAAIPGVTPVTGGTPITTITETAQYTGAVTWSPTAELR